MSALAAINHARTIRERLRNPPNAVADFGIDLRRKPVLTIVEKIEKVDTLPLGIGTPLPAYVLSYGPPAPPLPAPVRIVDIQRAVCKHYGVAMTDLCSARRTAPIFRPRSVAVWLCRKLTPRSLPEIGRMFGGRDHTTILHNVRKVEKDRASDPALDAELAAFIEALRPEPSV